MRSILADTDRTLLGVTIFLVCAGFIILMSASAPLSIKYFGHSYYYIFHQLILSLTFGAFLFFVGLRIPIDWYRRYALIFLVVAIVLILLVFVQGIGFGAGTAQRWIRLGRFSFQPSEMLKLAFVIYLAAWIRSKQNHVATLWKGLIPFLVLISIVGGLLINEPDFGTLGVLVVVSFLVFFLGGGNTRQVIVAGIIGVVLVGIAVATVPYARDRLVVFFSPSDDEQGKGYQINQARIAIGSGRLWGRGVGLSRQKFYYLPEPMGDAVFAVFAEEFGFIGVIFLSGAFFLFLIRGMVVAGRAKDQFARLLAAGITLLVVVQAAINMGALSGLFPLTGIPLPFVSYGGSALVFLFF